MVRYLFISLEFDRFYFTVSFFHILLTIPNEPNSSIHHHPRRLSFSVCWLCVLCASQCVHNVVLLLHRCSVVHCEQIISLIHLRNQWSIDIQALIYSILHAKCTILQIEVVILAHSLALTLQLVCLHRDKLHFNAFEMRIRNEEMEHQYG